MAHSWTSQLSEWRDALPLRSAGTNSAILPPPLPHHAVPSSFWRHSSSCSLDFPTDPTGLGRSGAADGAELPVGITPARRFWLGLRRKPWRAVSFTVSVCVCARCICASEAKYGRVHLLLPLSRESAAKVSLVSTSSRTRRAKRSCLDSSAVRMLGKNLSLPPFS